MDWNISCTESDMKYPSFSHIVIWQLRSFALKTLVSVSISRIHPKPFLKTDRSVRFTEIFVERSVTDINEPWVPEWTPDTTDHCLYFYSCKHPMRRFMNLSLPLPAGYMWSLHLFTTLLLQNTRHMCIVLCRKNLTISCFFPAATQASMQFIWIWFIH